jgi:hypothetical protein
MKAVFGGMNYTIMDKVSTGIRRLEILAARDAIAYDDMTDKQLVDALSREFNLSGLAIEYLGRLHNEIASLYLHIIDGWLRINAASSIGLIETKESRPPNYTPEMTRLRNISWAGYTPLFGGFCVREPIVRILQLARYPITKFAEITIASDLVIPSQPIIPDMPSAPVTMDRIITLRPHLIAREKWLVDMTKIVDEMIEQVRKSRAEIIS